MSCEPRLPQIVDLVASELEDELAIGLEQHLAECAACRHEETRLRNLLAWTQEERFELRDPIRRAIAQRFVRSSRPSLRLAAAAAAILVVAGGAFWLGRLSVPGPAGERMAPALGTPHARGVPLRFVSAPPELAAWSVPERGDSL